jgi:hypothetical protein
MQVRLARINEHWEARRGGMPKSWPHEWRHGSEPTRRPGYFPRPVEERSIILRKSFALTTESVDEAAFEMESMDYDFHLFNDTATGLDSVIYRPAPQATGWRARNPDMGPNLSRSRCR